MQRHLPPLNAIRAFESSARHASFTRAAQELFVTQGAVSRHVAGLEKFLGTKLFRRTQRGIELTAKGSVYFRTLRSVFDQLDYATRQLQERGDENLLHLKVAPTFAIRWLVPRLAHFHGLHPEIDVQMTTSHQGANFNREDVDVVVQSTLAPPAGPHRRILGEVLLPVCSPKLLQGPVRLKEPRDLAHHVLLTSLHRPHDWPAWMAAAGIDDIDGNSGLKFDYAALAYQAAIDELGVMIAQRAMVEEDLRQGRLVAPFDLEVRTTGAYYLEFAADRGKARRIALFEEWIVAEAERSR